MASAFRRLSGRAPIRAAQDVAATWSTEVDWSTGILDSVHVVAGAIQLAVVPLNVALAEQNPKFRGQAKDDGSVEGKAKWELRLPDGTVVFSRTIETSNFRGTNEWNNYFSTGWDFLAHPVVVMETLAAAQFAEERLDTRWQDPLGDVYARAIDTRDATTATATVDYSQRNGVASAGSFDSGRRTFEDRLVFDRIVVTSTVPAGTTATLTLSVRSEEGEVTRQFALTGRTESFPIADVPTADNLQFAVDLETNSPTVTPTVGSVEIVATEPSVEVVDSVSKFVEGNSVLTLVLDQIEQVGMDQARVDYRLENQPTQFSGTIFDPILEFYVDGELVRQETPLGPSPSFETADEEFYDTTLSGLEVGEHNVTVAIVGEVVGGTLEFRGTMGAVGDVVDVLPPLEFVTLDCQGVLPVPPETAEPGETLTAIFDADNRNAAAIELTVEVLVGGSQVDVTLFELAPNTLEEALEVNVTAPAMEGLFDVDVEKLAARPI